MQVYGVWRRATHDYRGRCDLTLQLEILAIASSIHRSMRSLDQSQEENARPQQQGAAHVTGVIFRNAGPLHT